VRPAVNTLHTVVGFVVVAIVVYLVAALLFPERFE
jgi:K+-transporting ATPase KdpF subunit